MQCNIHWTYDECVVEIARNEVGSQCTESRAVVEVDPDEDFEKHGDSYSDIEDDRARGQGLEEARQEHYDEDEHIEEGYLPNVLPQVVEPAP